MIDTDDYTQDVAAVIAEESGPMTGEELRDEGAAFYAKNPRLLTAHERAAGVFQRRGIPVSARFLTEFARWSTKLMALMPELFDIYRSVPVDSPERGLKIPNATSPWLTRHLKSRGFDVREARSKMDAS